MNNKIILFVTFAAGTFITWLILSFNSGLLITNKKILEPVNKEFSKLDSSKAEEFKLNQQLRLEDANSTRDYVSKSMEKYKNYQEDDFGNCYEDYKCIISSLNEQKGKQAEHYASLILKAREMRFQECMYILNKYTDNNN